MQMTDSTTADAGSGMETALLASRRCNPSGSTYLYSLAAVASVGGFLFGYDTGVVSGAMELIRRAWGLNDVQHEAIVSSTTGFAAIGAMLSGTANRKFGRKPVLVTAAIVFTLGALIMGFSRNFGELLAGRCVVGLAVGLASSTVPLYIAELAPPRMRGLLVSVNNSCIVIGQVAAAIVDGLFSGNRETGWRWMLGLGGVPSALQLLGLLFLPESPRWLISNGKEAEARAVLAKLRATGESKAAATSSSATDLDAVVEAEIEEIVMSLALAGQAMSTTAAGTTLRATVERAEASGAAGAAAATGAGAEAATAASAAAECSRSGAAADGQATVAGAAAARAGGVSFADLWAVRRQLTLGVGLLVLQQMIGINTIMYYSVSILLQAHIGTVQQSIWLAVPVAAAQLVGCIIGGLLIDRVGRRPLVLFSLIGAALSLGLEGSTFLLDGTFCNATSPPDALATATAAATATATGGPRGGGAYATLCNFKGWFSIGGMVIYLLCFGVGMSPVPWALNAEIYPMRVRTVCMGIATASNWVSAHPVGCMSSEHPFGATIRGQRTMRRVYTQQPLTGRVLHARRTACTPHHALPMRCPHVERTTFPPHACTPPAHACTHAPTAALSGDELYRRGDLPLPARSRGQARCLLALRKRGRVGRGVVVLDYAGDLRAITRANRGDLPRATSVGAGRVGADRFGAAGGALHVSK